ncbi:MAG: LysR family transcriptional regulator [Alphaproteobacteria bacterium]
MDRLDAMSTLLAVVDAGSLSAASRRLGMPLATVSRRLSDLEAHLGTRLVNRSSRGLSPTDAGRTYIDACRRIVEDVDAAERAAAGEFAAPKGELLATAPVVFGRLHLLPVINDFLTAYPEIDVRLLLADRTLNLGEDQIDVAARIGSLPDSNLIATRVGATARVVCASPGYLKRRGIPKVPLDLNDHDVVTFAGPLAPESWTFEVSGRRVAVPVRPRLSVNTAEAAVDAALAGVGLTRVLSYQVADAVRAGRLRLVLREAEPPPRPISLVHQGGAHQPRKLRAFLDFVAPRLRSAGDVE